MDNDFENRQTVAKATIISTATRKTESAIRQTENSIELNRTEQIERKIRYAKSDKNQFILKFDSEFHLIFF